MYYFVQTLFVLAAASVVLASNPIFGSFVNNPECELCLDQTYSACQLKDDPTFCLCTGDGFGDVLACKNLCHMASDDIIPITGYEIDANWQLYCTTETQCSAVEQLLAPNMYEKYCTGVNAPVNDTPDTPAASPHILAGSWLWIAVASPILLL